MAWRGRRLFIFGAYGLPRNSLAIIAAWGSLVLLRGRGVVRAAVDNMVQRQRRALTLPDRGAGRTICSVFNLGSTAGGYLFYYGTWRGDIMARHFRGRRAEGVCRVAERLFSYTYPSVSPWS